MMVDPNDTWQAKISLSHVMASCDNQAIVAKVGLISVEVFLNEGQHYQALGLLGNILP